MPEIPEPAYTVRVSLRAKRVILRALPGLGLEVVIPRGFDTRRVPALVAAKGEWIRRALRKIADRPLPASQHDPSVLPETVRLPAVGLHFAVVYAEHPPLRRFSLKVEQDRLLLAAPRCEIAACRALLLRWLRAEAAFHLAPWAFRLAADLGLPLAGVRIRNQRSRWGSCTARKTVSLNCKLLFLAPELARYVLLHELCHLTRLNHSPHFWERLARLEPDCRALDVRLRQARHAVPAWAG